MSESSGGPVAVGRARSDLRAAVRWLCVQSCLGRLYFLWVLSPWALLRVRGGCGPEDCLQSVRVQDVGRPPGLSVGHGRLTARSRRVLSPALGRHAVACSRAPSTMVPARDGLYMWTRVRVAPTDWRRPDPVYHCLRGFAMQGSNPARPRQGLTGQQLCRCSTRTCASRRRRRTTR